jgi:hypothetical protein
LDIGASDEDVKSKDEDDEDRVAEVVVVSVLGTKGISLLYSLVNFLAQIVNASSEIGPPFTEIFYVTLIQIAF